MSPKNPHQEPSAQALFRYQALSQVLLLERRGEVRSEAVRQVAARPHFSPGGQLRTVSARSLYRWLAAYEAGGFAALAPPSRSGSESPEALSPELLAFFETQKEADPQASIPELIRRARELGKISPGQAVCRSTVWRRLRRRGVDAGRRKAAAAGQASRFAYPHRLDLVLCDGKFFRAGAARLKRVALFFLDDATRMGLGAAVGPSESARLFMRGLYECIRRHGLMSALYVDNGSAFIARDSIEVLGRLGVLFIHGSVGYPQGRGKVERFNRTASEQLLRLLDGRPEVDPGCAALELRLNHYLEQRYNRTPHESLGGEAPLGRFQSDPSPLRLACSQPDLQEAFVLHTRRRVSRDRVVSVKGVRYEVPPGYAGARLSLHRNLLEGSVAMLHQGRLLRLAPLDPQANARRPRSAAPPDPAEPKPDPARPKSSAEMAFQRDLGPIVDAEGGFSEPDPPGPTKKKKEDGNE